MGKISNIVLPLVIGFFLTLGLNFLIQILTLENGTIAVGPPISIEGKVYSPIDITNFADETLNGLIVSIPISGTIITETISSGPVQIEEVPDTVGKSDRKRVAISGIEPNQVTRLLIPVADRRNVELVRVINPKQTNLTVQETENVRHPTLQILLRILGTTLLYSLVYALFLIEIERRFGYRQAQLREQIKDLSAKVAKESDETARMRAYADSQDKKIKETLNAATRIKIMLMARLSDYAKELDFWRDTIRKILYQSSHDKNLPENLINQVTETLKTYGTRESRDFDFRTVEVLAAMLNSKKENSTSKET